MLPHLSLTPQGPHHPAHPLYIAMLQGGHSPTLKGLHAPLPSPLGKVGGLFFLSWAARPHPIFPQLLALWLILSCWEPRGPTTLRTWGARSGLRGPGGQPLGGIQAHVTSLPQRSQET